MPKNNEKDNAEATAKTGSKTVSVDRALNERLRTLQIDPAGLPPHVISTLRTQADAEATRIHEAFTAAVATLHRKADEQTKQAIARLVTFKSVGKAFSLPPVKPSGTTPKTTAGAVKTPGGASTPASVNQAQQSAGGATK